jgi:hypothetical protein
MSDAEVRLGEDVEAFDLELPAELGERARDEAAMDLAYDRVARFDELAERATVHTDLPASHFGAEALFG